MISLDRPQAMRILSTQTRRRQAASASLALGLLAAASPVPAQDCLDVLVTDPSGAGVPNATVSIGSAEQPTDDSGMATFCGLGKGPHSIVAFAPGLEPREMTVIQSAGDVRAALALAAVSEQIVVVGSRTAGRAVLESAVPVDIVGPEDFTQQGDPDLVNQLRNTLPSFNVSTNPISDAGTIVRPASLRNLAPDHTLVLVNGKRRHRAAVIHWLSVGPTDGAQGADLAAIPAIAVKQAEVLRDGASAQYGSDAIAGAMNFVLKDAPAGGTLQVTAGSFGAGDGQTVTFAGNVGLPLGQGGFANLSIEYGNSKPTSRSVQRHDAQQLIANGNLHVRTPAAQIWGLPRVDDDVKFWGNFGKYVRGATQAYAHTNYASKRVEGGFYFRNPHTRSGVYGRGGNLLVGDLLDARDGILDGSAGCPVVPVTSGRVLDREAFDEVLANPNCFTFHQPFKGAPDGFPGGFTPQFGGYAEDASVVAGLRGAFSSGVAWDASFGLGSNSIDYFINNTINASLGPDSPTEFDPGKNAQNDTNLNFDLSYAASDSIHVAAGAEWRNEEFVIGAGEPDSWRFGPLAAQGFSAASNGFPGFSPIAVGRWNRSNYAAYGDIETGGPDRAYTLGVALRAERFTDFGPTVNYKFSGRVELGKGVSFRGSTSTGFRAPTPGQQNAFNITTLFDPLVDDVINSGTIPSTSAVAALVGGRPLKPERSRNYTAGAIFDRRSFSLAVDYFRIDLSDRLWFSKSHTLSNQEVDTLVAEGVTSAANLGTFRFFTNQIGTSSSGVELDATYAPEALDGDTAISFRLSHTKTEVTEWNPETVDDRRINLMENAFPETRWNLSFRHEAGRLRFLVRLSYWGDFFDREDGINYPGDYVLDAEASYRLTDSLSVSIGGQNLLNNYPEQNPFAFDRLGNRYPQTAPYGFNGGYYYTRLRYTWDKVF